MEDRWLKWDIKGTLNPMSLSQFWTKLVVWVLQCSDITHLVTGKFSVQERLDSSVLQGQLPSMVGQHKGIGLGPGVEYPLFSLQALSASLPDLSLIIYPELPPVAEIRSSSRECHSQGKCSKTCLIL